MSSSQQDLGHVLKVCCGNPYYSLKRYCFLQLEDNGFSLAMILLFVLFQAYVDKFKFQSITADEALAFYLDYFPELKAKNVDKIKGKAKSTLNSSPCIICRYIYFSPLYLYILSSCVFLQSIPFHQSRKIYNVSKHIYPSIFYSFKMLMLYLIYFAHLRLFCRVRSSITGHNVLAQVCLFLL